MSDMTPLATTEPYADLLARIDAKINALAQMFAGDAPVNIPAGALPIRFNTSTNLWEQWNGSAWGPLAAKYGITVDKADNVADNGGTYRTANTGAVASTIPVRDSSGKLPGSITGDAATVGGKAWTAFATSAQGTKADAALPATSYTAADVLTKIKTVDGAGSGLDADTIDGIQGNALITVSNIGDQSVDYATSAGSAATANNATTVGSKSVSTTHAADRLLCTGAQGFLGTIWGTSLAAAAASVSITGLDGNRDEVYEILVVGRKGEAGLSDVRVRFNGDTGSNYTESLNGAVFTFAPFGFIGSQFGVARLVFYAKTGAQRGGLSSSASSDGGTTMGTTESAISYANTSTNITTATVFMGTGTFAAGTKIIVRRLI